jgi:hypothetical protein
MARKVEIQFKKYYSEYYKLMYRYKNIFSTWKPINYICYMDDFYGLTYEVPIVNSGKMDKILNLLLKRIEECDGSFSKFLSDNQKLKKEWDLKFSKYTRLSC